MGSWPMLMILLVLVATLFYQNEPGTPPFFGLKSPTSPLLFGVLQEAHTLQFYLSFRGKWGTNDEESCDIEHQDLSYVEIRKIEKALSAARNPASLTNWGSSLSAKFFNWEMFSITRLRDAVRHEILSDWQILIPSILLGYRNHPSGKTLQRIRLSTHETWSCP